MGTESAALEENLDLFAQARCWKAYVRSRISRDLVGRVLEVGAGIGGNTECLLHEGVSRWLCLEPDPDLAAKIPARLDSHPLGRRTEVCVGTTEDLAPDEYFDSAVYLDVLEHIEDDQGELERVGDRLSDAGCIVAVSPAHQSLYTDYDAHIGHHRRYDKAMLRDITPANLSLERLEYLDAVGALASLANRFLLRQGDVRPAQFFTWDRLMVPLSRAVDPLLGRQLGKSILSVWRKH